VTYDEYLRGVDCSHQMTTAPEHITALCEVVAGMNWEVLELGSHAGISTAALALAAPESNVISVDLCDTIPEAVRTEYWSTLGIANIKPVAGNAWEFLRWCQQKGIFDWDFVFHDAAHGDGVLHEYTLAASMTRVLAIHDWEQLSPSSQAAVSQRFSKWTATPDSQGRELFIGRK
jgi:predicted O-methyltransferase YrrM